MKIKHSPAPRPHGRKPKIHLAVPCSDNPWRFPLRWFQCVRACDWRPGTQKHRTLTPCLTEVTCSHCLVLADVGLEAGTVQPYFAAFRDVFYVDFYPDPWPYREHEKSGGSPWVSRVIARRAGIVGKFRNKYSTLSESYWNIGVAP